MKEPFPWGNGSFFLYLLSVSESLVEFKSNISQTDQDEDRPDVVYDVDDEVSDSVKEIFESVDEGTAQS